jgi:chorismate mutase
MPEQTLRELRLGIRAIDSELAHLLGRRMKLARKIGEMKRKLKLPIVNSAVEMAVVENFVR